MSVETADFNTLIYYYNKFQYVSLSCANWKINHDH